MSTLAAAQALAEGLDFDALSVKYNDLQILYETSEKQQEALRNEIQRVRSELQAALARASEQELQKQNVIIQYETSTLNERKLSDQLATIASDLTSFKGSNNELVNKNSELNKRLTTLVIQNGDIGAVNKKNEMHLDKLKERIDTLASEKADSQQKLYDSEELIRSLRNAKAQEAKKMANENFKLEREYGELQFAHQDLRLQLLQSNNKSESTAAELESLTKKYAALSKINTTMKNDHRSLIDVYEQRMRQVNEENQRLRQLYDEKHEALETVELQLRSENEELQGRLNTLEASENLMTRSSSGTTYRHEEMNKVMLQRDSYQGLCDRLKSELSTKTAQCNQLLKQNTELQSRVNSLAAEKPANEEIKRVKKESADLKQKNQDLKSRLENTTHQLYYILREVQSSEVLAPYMDQPTDLSMYDKTLPNIPHDRLVFKNIEELVQKNQDLQRDLNVNNNQLRSKTQQVERITTQYYDIKQKYDHETDIARKNILDLNNTINSLKSSLSDAMDKYRMSEKALQENIKRTTPFVNTELQQKIVQYQKRIEQLESNSHGAYQDMQQDMAKIQKELEEAVQDSVIAKEDRQKIQTELSHIQTEHAHLVEALSMHSTREKGLNKAYADLKQHLEEREVVLQQCKEDLLSSRNTADHIRQERQQISIELEFSNQRIQQLVQDNQELLKKQEELDSLLQGMATANANDDTNNPEELNKILKNRLEMRERELRLLRDKVDTTKKDLQDYMQREVEHWKPMLNEVEKELGRIRTERIQLEKDLSTAKEQQTVLETKLAAKERELAAAQMSMAEDDPEHFRMKLAAARDETTDLQKQVTFYKERLDTLNEQATALQKEHDLFVDEARGKLTKTQSALQERNLRIKEMETAVEENEKLRQEKSDLEQHYQNEKVQTEKLGQEQKARQQEVIQLQTILTENIQRVHDLEKKLANADTTHAQDSAMIEELRVEGRNLEKQLAKAQSELHNVTTQLKTAQLSVLTEKEASQSKESTMRLELDDVRSQLASLSKIHEDLLSTVSDTQKSSLSPAENAKLIADLSDRTVETLRKVNASLRHENDVLHGQYTEAQEESERSTLHLEFVRKQLDATRTELERVRDENLRIGDEYARTTQDAQHKAATYKEENERLQQMVTELEKNKSTLRQELAQKEKELSPLKSRVQELEAKSKTYENTMKVVEQTRAQWNNWTNQILSKSNQIDPSEHQRIQDECAELKKTVEIAEASKNQVQFELNKVQKELEIAKQNITKLQTVAGSYKRRFDQADAELKEERAKTKTSSSPQQGKAEVGDKNVESLQKELDQKAAQLQQRIKVHENLQKKHQDLLSKTKEIIGVKNSLAEEHKKCGSEITKLREDLKKSTEDLEKSTEQLNKYIEEKKTSDMENARARAKQSFDANKIAKLTAQLEELQRAKNNNNDATEEGEV